MKTDFAYDKAGLIEPLFVAEGEGGATLLTGDTPGEGAQADEGTPPAEGGDKPGETGDAPAGAPESYEAFTLPEGVTFEGDELTSFNEFAKGLGLSQEQAQQLLGRDLAAKAAADARLAEESQAAIAQWAETAKADKEFGGEKFAENAAIARKALETFGGSELKSMLNNSGLGNHPEVIRFMYRVGQAISEDKLVTGSAAPAPARLYPNSNHSA